MRSWLLPYPPPRSFLFPLVPNSASNPPRHPTGAPRRPGALGALLAAPPSVSSHATAGAASVAILPHGRIRQGGSDGGDTVTCTQRLMIQPPLVACTSGTQLLELPLWPNQLCRRTCQGSSSSGTVACTRRLMTQPPRSIGTAPVALFPCGRTCQGGSSGGGTVSCTRRLITQLLLLVGTSPAGMYLSSAFLLL